MKSEKRFYWIKLSENIFKDNPIVFNLAGGNDVFRLYIELCLKAINTNGVLNFNKKISIFSSLAAMTKMNEKILKKSLKLLIKFELVIKRETFILEINNFSTMIGSVSKDAIRKRKQRENRKNKDKSLSNEKTIVDNVPLSKDKVRDVSQNCPTNCPTKLGREEENKRDKEIEIRERFKDDVKTSSNTDVKTSVNNKKEINNINSRFFKKLKAAGIDNRLNEQQINAFFDKIVNENGEAIATLINDFVLGNYLTKKIKVSYLSYLKQFYASFKKDPYRFDFYKQYQHQREEVLRIIKTPWINGDDDE